MIQPESAIQMASAPARIAFFDLDRTITRSGTYTPFLLHCAQSNLRSYSGIPAALWAMGSYLARRTTRAALKARMLDLSIAGASRTEVSAWAEEFVDRWLRVQVRPGALEAIQRHRQSGDRVVLATASFDFYAKVFATRLGLDDAITTKSVWTEADRLCAAVDGENCYGEAKVAAVEKYLLAFPSRPWFVFYTDHHSDFDLMEMADAGVAVNPSAKLRRLAKEHQFPVVDWG